MTAPAATACALFKCVCDAGKGVFDRLFVDHAGVIVVGPFAGVGVVGMAGVRQRLEHVVEAGDAAELRLSCRGHFASRSMIHATSGAGTKRHLRRGPAMTLR